jgi:hypothetical protein
MHTIGSATVFFKNLPIVREVILFTTSVMNIIQDFFKIKSNIHGALLCAMNRAYAKDNLLAFRSRFMAHLY